MDTELFQWVLLALLSLAVLVLLALLAALSGIRKALEGGSSAGSARVPPGWASEPPQSDATESDVAQRAETTPSSQLDTSPASGTATSSAPAAAEGRAGSIRSVLEQHGLGDATSAQQSEEPRDAGSAAAQAPEHRPDDSAFAAHADDPQDEPFQRDGRWWFRRGDELLVYDETSAQWEAAPEPGAATGAGPAGGAAGTDAGGARSSLGGEGGVQTTAVSEPPEVADDVATFWKCPTCGAVNGSTAATCRMCFAARP